MKPDDFLALVIAPGCAWCSEAMGRDMGTAEAKVLMLAIALQESALEYRRQVGGPARGWWQFESGGGVHGVMNHSASAATAQTMCAQIMVPWVQADIHESIAWHDQLAPAFARLLLWTDPAPLPELGDEQGAWDTYLRIWRPGKPHPEAWPEHYATALETVLGPIKPPVGDNRKLQEQVG